jgi:protein-disulfide isomerase
MANHENTTDPWVDAQLNALAPPSDSGPNTPRALALLRERIHARRTARPGWWWFCALPVSVLGLLLILVPGSRACAQRPGACADRLLTVVFPAHVNSLTNYKQLGSAAAPITLEIYIDYQCPPCATFYQNVIPLLKKQYVEPGKLRLVFRDWPNPNHKYADLAARFVNAAGQLGYYPAAMQAIFDSQSIWSKNGDLDAQLARILPPDVMKKVRVLVAQETNVADTIAAGQDHLNRTPSIVAVVKGKREILPGDLTFDRIKAHLESVINHAAIGEARVPAP